MKIQKLIRTVIVTLCAMFSTHAPAVIPSPDGGYPGFNTAEGTRALQNLSSGVANSAVGWYSLFTNSIGSYNTAFGAGTLAANNEDENTAIGAGALLSNTAGAGNTATGTVALVSNTTGGTNTAVGYEALQTNTTGNFNISMGAFAGAALTTGDNNIDIGNPGAAAEAGTIRIGIQAVQSATYIAGISGITVPSGISVIVDNNGHLGTFTSSKRFKKDIKPMGQSSEGLFGLKPVTFHYTEDIDPVGTPQFGLVAEDVEKIDPHLIVRDKGGKAHSVRYDQVNAMLLNEFLKEHRAVEAQQKKINEQEKMMNELKSTLAQQEKTFQSKTAQQQEQIELLTSGFRKICDRLQLDDTAIRVVAEK